MNEFQISRIKHTYDEEGTIILNDFLTKNETRNLIEEKGLEREYHPMKNSWRRKDIEALQIKKFIKNITGLKTSARLYEFSPGDYAIRHDRRISKMLCVINISSHKTSIGIDNEKIGLDHNSALIVRGPTTWWLRVGKTEKKIRLAVLEC